MQGSTKSATKSSATNGASASSTRKPTLRQLATTANKEHAQVHLSGKAMLEHAILSGEALIAAKNEALVLVLRRPRY